MKIFSLLCDPYIYVIRTSSTQMALYKYFKKAPSVLPNPKGSLSGCMTSKAISSANCEMSGLVHQDTGQNSKTINTTRGQYTSFSTTKSISSSIASQSLLSRSWIRIGSIRLIMEAWVLFYLSRPYLFIQFSRNQIFPLIREIYSPRNISALRYH